MELYCSKKTPFFVYDAYSGMAYFAAEQEQREYAKKLIKGYFDELWDGNVTNVTMGKVTHQATMTNRDDRPPEDEIDEDGDDLKGAHWQEEVGYKCRYEMLPIKKDE